MNGLLLTDGGSKVLITKGVFVRGDEEGRGGSGGRGFGEEEETAAEG